MATNRHEYYLNCEKVQNSENTQNTFLELVKAGLWGGQRPVQEFKVQEFKDVDWGEVYRLAEEQSVIGLVSAGIDWFKVHDSRFTVPQEWALQFVGQTLQIEQRNKAMNQFVAELVEKMRAEDIYTLLVKGQGVAQCYKRPLWRPSGDVDFLLSEDNYAKAKALLLPLSSSHKNEERYSQHLGMSIGQWYVEIHGSLRTGLSARVDREVDKVVLDSLNMVNGEFGEGARVWKNGTTDVYLPEPTNDVFLVFTHFIKHFYKEGMSLRQVCDWCRLLWTYKESLDYGKLESWIRKSGLMEEWKTFASLAVDYLGMQEQSMPLYDAGFTVKGSRLIDFILGGYLGNKVKDTLRIAKIFPWKALRYSPSIFLNVNWLKVKERFFNS